MQLAPVGVETSGMYYINPTTLTLTGKVINEITFQIHDLVPAGTYPVNISIGGEMFNTGLTFTVTP